MKRVYSLRGFMLRLVSLAAVLTALLTVALLQAIWPSLTGDTLTVQMSGMIAIVIVLIVLVLNVFVTYQVSKRIRKHLDDITAYTAVLSRGNLAYRMDVPGIDEIDRVALELNSLAETMEKQVSSLQRLAEYNEKLAGQVHSAAIVEERQRLARDLHDAVSQQLFALTMLADAAVVAVRADKVPEGRHISDIADLAAQIQQEMRALLLHLRPVQLTEESFADGIKSLVNELEQKSGLAFDVTLEGMPGISRSVENHLFRIIQEALTNILRHANAGLVRIKLFCKESELFLQISDDGSGFDPTQEKKASYGLKTMRERCEEIGGQFSVTSRASAGTRIDIRIPIKQEEGKDV